MSVLLMSWNSQREKEEIKRKKKKIIPEEKKEKWKKEKEEKEEKDEKPKKRLKFEYSEEDRKRLSKLVSIEKNWNSVTVHSIKWIHVHKKTTWWR